MRKIIAAFGLLAAFAAAVLVALPILIDQEAVQRKLREQVAEISGQRLTINGQFGVKLLPSPSITISKATIRNIDVDGLGPQGDVDRIDLQVDLPGLLAGKPVIREMRLIRPAIRVVVDGRDVAGWLNLPLREYVDPVFERLSVVNARVDLVSADGRQQRVDALEGQFAIDAQSGRRKVELAGMLAGRSVVLDMDMSEPHAGRRSSIDIALQADDSQLILRGQVQAGERLPLFAGEFEGTPRLLVDLATFFTTRPAWMPPVDPATTFSGHLQVATDYLKVERGIVRHGNQEVMVDLSAALRGRPEVQAAVTIDDLELGYDIDPVSFVPLLFSSRLAAALPVDLSAMLRVDIGRLGLAGEDLRRIDGQISLDGGGAGRINAFNAILPGSGELSLEGDLRVAAHGLELDGHLRMASEDVPGLRDMLGLGLAGLRHDAITGMNLDSNIGMGPHRFELRDMKLRLDGTKVEGGLALVDGAQPQVAAKLRVDRLDLDMLAVSGGDGNPLESDDEAGWGDRLSHLRQWLAGFDHALDLIVDRASLGPLRLQGLSLKSRMRDGEMVIEELAIGDALDATARFAGVMDLDLSVMDLEGSVDISSPARVLRELGYEAPLVMSLLGPVRVETGLEGAASSSRLTVKLDGGDLKGDLSAAGTPDAFDLHGSLAADGSGDLVRRLAALVLDAPLSGSEARVDIDWNGRKADRPSGTARLKFGQVQVDASLAVDDSDSASGQVVARNVTPSMGSPLYDGLSLLLGLEPGPVARWVGAWPKRSWHWTWPFSRHVTVDLEALDGDGAPIVQGRMTMGADAIGFTPMRMEIGNGSLTLDSRYKQTGLDLNVELDGVEVATVLDWLGIGDGLSGRMDMALDMRAVGENLWRLLSTLAGEGHFEISGGSMMLPGGVVERQAFDAIEGDLGVEHGILEVRHGRIVHDAPATGDQPGVGGPGQIPFEARLDLPAWMLDALLAGTAPVHVIGPPGRLAIRP
ncbi:MAG: AsmA family protein [Geminicoccaceae bacterium]|nr:AsmA family protein [Geminicoccaceae bacterium]